MFFSKLTSLHCSAVPFLQKHLARSYLLSGKETDIYLKYSNYTVVSVIFFYKIKMNLMCTCLYSVSGRMDMKLMALSLLGRRQGGRQGGPLERYTF